MAKPKLMKKVAVKPCTYTVIGSDGSKMRATTPQASPSVGIRKNIQAKLTMRNVMTIFTALPHRP